MQTDFLPISAGLLITPCEIGWQHLAAGRNSYIAKYDGTASTD